MNELSDENYALILEKINCFYSELLGKYDIKKYNEQEYERLCSIFKSPANIVKRDIEDALAWKYGKTHKNLLKNPKYEDIISSFVDGWPSFIGMNVSSEDAVFNYWNEKIGASFVSVAFITHLIYPSKFPIVDQHTFRAMRYFLGRVGHSHGVRKVPGSLKEIHTLRDFVCSLAKAKNVGQREFDRYLMMFGKHVAPRSENG